MGEDACMDCRSWVEEIYWTHFQCTQFCQVLDSGFDHQLAIPKSFSNNLKKKLPEIVTLKGPSGSTWDVGLTTNDGTAFFKHGWEEFIKTNFLQEKDLLIFKYTGDTHFDVLIFDGRSLCEKAAPYFVRKCGHEEYNGGCQPKRKFGESSSKGALPSPMKGDGSKPPQHGDGGTPPEKLAHNVIGESSAEAAFTTSSTHGGNADSPPEKCPADQVDPSWREPITAQAANKKMRGSIKFTPVHLKPTAAYEERSTCADELEIKPDVEHKSNSSNVGHGTSTSPATEKAKSDALCLATTALSTNGFLVVMRPTHVYRKFNLGMPAAWISKHIKVRSKQDIILRIQDKTWTTRFLCWRERRSGGLCSGWKTFVADNKLQEFDVCVFEPTSYPVNNSITLDVHIYRAISQPSL